MEGNYERDSSPCGKFPGVVTTLYHAHNSNVFKSSESSVQITSAVTGLAHGGSSRTSQNFCELDIVSRREKEKFADGHSVTIATDASKNTPPNTPQMGGIFRKKLYDRQISDNKSGILCLANVVKDVDEEYCKPIISRTKEKDERAKSPFMTTGNTSGDYSDPKQKQLNDFLKCKQYCEVRKKSREDGRGEMERQIYYLDSHKVKKSRSVSRKRRGKGRSPTSKSVDQKSLNVSNGTKTDVQESLDEPSLDPQTESSKKMPMKFVDLAQARAMYFVELPNRSAFRKNSPKGKHRKENDSLSGPNVIEREDPKLGHIIINKIDGEYPTATSLETESTVPIKLKSEVCFDSFAVIKKKQKKHNNSPQPEDTPKTQKANKESTKGKGKHKKKHRPSPRASFTNDVAMTQIGYESMNYDFVPCKEEKKPDKEVEVLYKKKLQRKTSATRNARSRSNRTGGERKSNKHSSKSPTKEGKLREKKDKTPIKEKTVTEKGKKDKSPKREKKNDKKRSVTPTVRRVHSATRMNKFDDKRDVSPKNLKAKDPSQKSKRKISPVHPKGYDQQKAKRGQSPNQIKGDQTEVEKKRKDNTDTIFKEPPEPKEVRESKDATNVVYDPKHFPRDLKNYEHETKTIGYYQAYRTTQFDNMAKKQRVEVEEQKKHAIDMKDMKEKAVDNVFVGLFAHDNLQSVSCMMLAEQDVKSPFTALIRNRSKVIGDRTHSKTGKPRITVKTASSNDRSACLRKRNGKKLKSKSNVIKHKPIFSKCTEIIEFKNVDTTTKTVADPPLLNLPARPIVEEKLVTMGTPLIAKAQCLGVGKPVNNYMGYFVPPQVAARFSRKYSTPHSVVPELLKPSEKTHDSVVLNAHPKIKRSRSCVPSKLTETNSDYPSMLSPSKSQILSSKKSSDTNVSRKTRSKSVVTKADPMEIDKVTLGTIESREHLRRELKKLHAIQQTSIRKRLKVTSKSIEKNEYEGSNHSSGVTGSNRLKPRLPSKQEQDAILNLPIFQNDMNMSSTNSLTSSEISGIKVNTVLKLHSHTSPNTEEEPCHPDEARNWRNGRRQAARREVSFSQLNTRPLPELYTSPRSDKLEFYDTLNGDEKKTVSKATLYSEATDVSLDYKENERKLQSVHMILGEKIIEICNKITGNDGKIVEGCTVSGIEPPKKLRCGGRSNVEMKYARNTDKLHLMFFPATQIINNEIQPKESYAYGIFIQPAAVKESNYVPDHSDKSTMSGDSIEKSLKKTKSDVGRSLIQVKTKRKLLPFELVKKKNKGLMVKKASDVKLFKKSEGTEIANNLNSKFEKSWSSLFLEVSSSDDKSQINIEPVIEPLCKKQQKKPHSPRQEIRSLSRINSAVRMMESSLQIIKEESQSTDSSAKVVSDKRKKMSVTDIKQTQTELVTNDLDKMKEVINYLYMAFDRKEPRNIVNCLQDPRDIITKLEVKPHNHSSSTESSSCCEQFKNMVKNVKPKFGTLKRMSKPELSQKSPVLSRCSTSDGVISPTKASNEERSATAPPDTCAFICMNLHDSSTTLIPPERLCCSGDTKFFRQGNPSLPSPKNRTNLAQHLKLDRSPQFSTTKDLLNNLRTSKSIHAEPEKHDKAICTDSKPEIKSSTSISDFSSVVVSIDEVERERLQQIQTAPKLNEEKSVQCALIEDGNCKSESSGFSEKLTKNNCQSKQIKTNVDVQEKPTAKENKIILKEKIFENKSLQTSSTAAKPKFVAELEKALPQFACNIMYSSKVNDKNSPLRNLDRKSSTNTFGSHRYPRHCNKGDSESSQDSLTVTQMSMKVYKNKKQHDRSLCISRRDKSHKSGGRKIPGKKTVEVDYVNLLKLERHLEQVLGLYPTVCKAIRTHMTNNMSTTNNVSDKYGFKDNKKILFASQDTLATTVDTITEYNVMDTDENMSRSSHRNLKFPLNKYLYESRFKFPKPAQNSKKNKSRYSLFASSGSSRNLELAEPSTPYPYTDTTSSSSKGREYRMIQYKKDRKPSKWTLKRPKRYKRGGFNFYNKVFSDDVKDNWSIGSPLYSVSTPSLTLSRNDLAPKTKSKSLTTTQVLTSQLSTSKSLIEISSNKNTNRRAIIHKIKEDLLNSGKGKSFRLGSQQVFVLSLDSTKSTSPLLAKVEHQFQHEQSEHTASKVTEPKTKIDETNCYSLLFSENGRAKRRDRANALNGNRPFYIHNRQSSSSDMDFFDSIDNPRKSEDQDLGNFSADSLDSTSVLGDDALNYTMELVQNNLIPKQNFFVYTSTVNYGTNPVNMKMNNEKPLKPCIKLNSRPSSKHSSRKSGSSRHSSRSGSIKRFLSPTQKAGSSPTPFHNQAPNPKSVVITQTGTIAQKSSEDSSNTLISESGYETSNRTKPTASIKSFFKKGGSLLDLFRHTTKSKSVSSGTNLTNFSHLYSKTHDNQPDTSTASTNRPSQDDEQTTSTSGAKIFWSSLAKNKHSEKAKITFTGATYTDLPESRDKFTCTTANKKCSVNSGKSFEKQMCACHEYAEKVVQESQMKKEGYMKQYKDFEEIPLELLIGRKVPLAFRKGPAFVQMNATASAPVSPRYPYYESNHVLQDKEPFVTFIDDKIVFQSSQTNLDMGYRSKPTSPSRSVQSKSSKQKGSLHNIFYRSKSSLKNVVQNEGENTSENHKVKSSKRMKSQDFEPKDRYVPKSKSSEKGIDRLGLFRKKRSKSSLGCLCDSEDESFETTIPRDPRKSARSGRQTTSSSRTVSPYRKRSKKKISTETEMERPSRSRATDPVEELQSSKWRMCTRGTKMEIKPWHKSKGTEPMPADRIKTSVRESQMERSADGKAITMGTGSEMEVLTPLERGISVPRKSFREFFSRTSVGSGTERKRGLLSKEKSANYDGAWYEPEEIHKSTTSLQPLPGRMIDNSLMSSETDIPTWEEFSKRDAPRQLEARRRIFPGIRRVTAEKKLTGSLPRERGLTVETPLLEHEVGTKIPVIKTTVSGQLKSCEIISHPWGIVTKREGDMVDQQLYADKEGTLQAFFPHSLMEERDREQRMDIDDEAIIVLQGVKPWNPFSIKSQTEQTNLVEIGVQVNDEDIRKAYEDLGIRRQTTTSTGFVTDPLHKDPSRTVYTQIEQEPVVKSVYKPQEKAAPLIETIFESKKELKEPEIDEERQSTDSQKRKSILRPDSRFRRGSPYDLEQEIIPNIVKHVNIEDHDSNVYYKKKLERTKQEHLQQTTLLQTQSSGDVFLKPQEELVDEDEQASLANESIISITRKESLKSTKIVDSLLIHHKSCEKRVEENIEDPTVQVGTPHDTDRHISVTIMDTPTILERKSDSIELSDVPSIASKLDEKPDRLDDSLELKVDNPSVHSCASFIDKVLDEIIDNAIDESTFKSEREEPKQELSELIDAELLSLEDHRTSIDEDMPHIIQSEVTHQPSEDFRKGLTDKEVFDKLLTSFEKEDEIAVRLSKDDNFFNEQIKQIKRDSEESILDNIMDDQKEDNIFTEDTTGEKHRSTHFWEEKMKSMRAKEENPVKTDDIGTCFARGFRPDNIALSGDACFNLNKQDKIKFSKGMLTNDESIIDFSERETPLDYLLALGFMVDEASNALKDDDIRSRLLAAITEARVWINKITTTQGTLLYLVAYKSRPKTMRYFLQLVEAIINKRINNAIKLDGFLRVLEKVEEGEIQMINILGADKFEDEENEEKIVKKQLRQLFITVYKIAEKEAQQKGNELSIQAVVLLRILAAKYRAGLHPHLELIARYIGQDLLNTETQLEAAMIFLSRLDTAEVKLKEFEAYCDIKCEKKKQKQSVKQQDASAEEVKAEKVDPQQSGSQGKDENDD